MAYIRFLGEKTSHKATVIPTGNVVTVKFDENIIENQNGFDVFLDKKCQIDIGGDFYRKFTTVYRNDAVTNQYNGYSCRVMVVCILLLKFHLIQSLYPLR